jgi:hypothetical protein
MLRPNLSMLCLHLATCPHRATQLEALGIRGTPLSWFGSYMTGGRQCVDWNGTCSGYVEVRYGIRQGSILGPVLYLVHVADFPDCVKVGDTKNMTYADDTGV